MMDDQLSVVGYIQDFVRDGSAGGLNLHGFALFFADEGFTDG
jgi:hypothetical protein